MKLQDQIAINNMRLEGHAPSEIAAKLGLSPSTVRSYIHRHRHISGIKVCKHCGKRIEQPKGRREKKFCSDTCRMAYWNGHKEEVNKQAYYKLTCQQCGKEFESYGNASRKYCCRECYRASRRAG